MHLVSARQANTHFPSLTAEEIRSNRKDLADLLIRCSSSQCQLRVCSRVLQPANNNTGPLLGLLTSAPLPLLLHSGLIQGIVKHTRIDDIALCAGSSAESVATALRSGGPPSPTPHPRLHRTPALLLFVLQSLGSSARRTTSDLCSDLCLPACPSVCLADCLQQHVLHKSQPSA